MSTIKLFPTAQMASSMARHTDVEGLTGCGVTIGPAWIRILGTQADLTCLQCARADLKERRTA